MQTLASYCFYRIPDPAQLDTCLRELSQMAEQWLVGKGAADPISSAGSFKSKTGGQVGSYAVTRAIDDDRGVFEVLLHEPSPNAQTFSTRLSICHDKGVVTVYATLTVANVDTSIAPTYTDARCPAIVRAVLDKFSDWVHGGEAVPRHPEDIAGEDEGRALGERIQKPRMFPIVVVSKIDDEELLDGLAAGIAYDLAGLAHVVVIDEDASWGLSDAVGKINSCYLGAVRLYWPNRGGSAHPNSVVWTSAKLLPAHEDEDAKAALRFRSMLRYRVMSASALSVSPTLQLVDIETANATKRFAELVAQSEASAEATALMNLLMEEKKAIAEELRAARAEIASLRSQLRDVWDGQAPDADGVPANDDTYNPPKDGETRFYKKTHSKGKYDVLVHIEDCGHTSWQNSAKADKAKKGLVRLEGRQDWKSLHHCGSCTGGGVWRARW